MKRLVMMIALTLATGIQPSGKLYTMPCTVTENSGEYALVEDCNGDLWAIDNEDYRIGESCVMLIDDCNTFDNWDDEIIRVFVDMEGEFKNEIEL